MLIVSMNAKAAARLRYRNTHRMILATSIHTQRIELPSIFEGFLESTFDCALFDYHRNTRLKIACIQRQRVHPLETHLNRA